MREVAFLSILLLLAGCGDSPTVPRAPASTRAASQHSSRLAPATGAGFGDACYRLARRLYDRNLTIATRSATDSVSVENTIGGSTATGVRYLGVAWTKPYGDGAGVTRWTLPGQYVEWYFGVTHEVIRVTDDGRGWVRGWGSVDICRTAP